MTKAKKKITVPFRQAMQLILPYCYGKLVEQITVVLPIFAYLVLFQKLVLGIPIAEAAIISAGMVMVIIGLAFFLEGLLLGIMPLGEVIGATLPIKAGIIVLILLSFSLGVGATLAEPAINVLRAAGIFVRPWNAPLLYMLLNTHTDMLVMAIGTGVGIAIIIGALRFTFNISIKPILFVLLPLIMLVTSWGFFDENVKTISGLAWDSGSVTTGPVTVPLILAYGIGICRSAGGQNSGAMGFGVVALASTVPILTVLILGISLSLNTPQPVSKEIFFSPEFKEQALHIVGSQGALEQISAQFNAGNASIIAENMPNIANIQETIFNNFAISAQAILPLTIFLLGAFTFILREKLPKKDEIFFGIFIATFGMGLFNTGMEYGLTKIGTQVGGRLPSSFSPIELPESAQVIHNFQPSLLNSAINAQGDISHFFYKDDNSRMVPIDYDQKFHDTEKKTYTHIPVIGPLFDTSKSPLGYFVVILFAFILGYGATLAEPALSALGTKVEELTVGTFKKTTLIYSVGVGVGTGLCLGAAKVIWDLPITWLLFPPYLILLVLTKYSTEEFVNIGWDSAGVTTGPVTVPLVIAMGLGIGKQVGVVEGFGVLSLASVYTILVVLLMGAYTNWRAKKLLAVNDKGTSQ